MFNYSSGSIFPDNISLVGDNYWVDVVFNDTSQDPQANNDAGFTTLENTALSIPSSALLANDTDPPGYTLSFTGVSDPRNGTAVYNSTAQTVTFVPTTGYTGPASFTYSISDELGGIGTGTVSLTVNYPVTAQSLFNTADTPSIVTVNNSNSVELGVKFQASTTGAITGIRFYKGPQNSGAHVADLWSATGTLLASATFTNETASGWQQVNLSTPVIVTAGTTYVVSYHTDGNYSADPNYFATSHTNGDLTALASGTSGSDGLYAYGTGQIFPTETYNASNYWVDVVFDGSSLQPPVANNDNGVAIRNTPLSIAASALLANDTDLYGLPLSITGAGSANNGTVSVHSSTQTVNFVPAANYTGSAGFDYTITDGRGNTASANVALTVTFPPPVANDDSGFVVTENGALSIPVLALLANDTDPNGLPVSFAGWSNSTNGSVTYDPNTQTINFVPSIGYAGPASFNYSISDELGGIGTGAVFLVVNYPVTAQSLFNTADTPSIVTVK